MFTFLKKIISLCVLLVVVVIAGKFFVEYQLRKNLDEHLSKNSAIVGVHYRTLYLDRSGGVNIDNIEISSSLFDVGENRISSLRVTSENKLLFILQGLGIEKAVLPNTLTFESSGVELGAFSGELINSLIASVNKEFTQKAAPSCGDTQFFSASDYSLMGYENLLFDFDLSYAYSESRQILELTVDAFMPDMASTKSRVIFGNVASIGPSLVTNKPSLQLIELDYEDLGYVERANEYCSKKMNMSVDDFIAREISREGKYFLASWGVNPGESLRAAYGAFLKSPQSITFAAYPSEDFNFQKLSLYDTKDWAGLLRLSLLVNEKAIAPLEFTLSEGVQASSKKTEKVTDESTVSAPKAFTAIDKSELSKYKGYKLRLQSVNGRVREGLFQGLSDGNIQLGDEKYGNSLIISVSVSSVVKIEVYK